MDSKFGPPARTPTFLVRCPIHLRHSEKETIGRYISATVKKKPSADSRVVVSRILRPSCADSGGRRRHRCLRGSHSTLSRPRPVFAAPAPNLAHEPCGFLRVGIIERTDIPSLANRLNALRAHQLCCLR